MKLECIVTLVNLEFRNRFLALERSLRNTGCDLPIRVIPYDDHLFDLPPRSSWWHEPRLLACLSAAKAHPTFRKYQCLTVANYQYVDSDIRFIRNPAEVLAPHQGFVTCCGHWRDATHAVTTETIELLKKRSTMWQRSIFNAGQFACDQALFTVDSLLEAITSPQLRKWCIDFPYHDQVGMNLLVHQTEVAITNMTLPPFCLESSWAGDYGDDYRQFIEDNEKGPYLMHWAGIKDIGTRAIDEMFVRYLSPKEISEMHQTIERQSKLQIIAQIKQWIRRALRRP